MKKKRMIILIIVLPILILSIFQIIPGNVGLFALPAIALMNTFYDGVDNFKYIKVLRTVIYIIIGAGVVLMNLSNNYVLFSVMNSLTVFVFITSYVVHSKYKNI